MGQKIKSILYIDDDTNIRALMQAALARQRPDCEVITFSDSDKLLAFLMQNSADLLLVDYILPEISTAKLLKIVRSISDIPLIIISGVGYSEMKNISNVTGLIGTLQKPFSIKTISDEIEFLWSHAQF